MFCPAGNAYGNSQLFCWFVNWIYGFFQIGGPFVFFLGDNGLYLLENIGIWIFKAQIFKFTFCALHTKTVCQWCPNVYDFWSNQALFFFVDGSKVSHAVKAVSQLYQNDPDVVYHGKEHFSDGIGLLYGGGIDFHARDFWSVLYNGKYSFAEFVFDFFLAHSFDFKNWVEETWNNWIHVQFCLGKKGGNPHGVEIIGESAGAG